MVKCGRCCLIFEGVVPSASTPCHSSKRSQHATLIQRSASHQSEAPPGGCSETASPQNKIRGYFGSTSRWRHHRGRVNEAPWPDRRGQLCAGSSPLALGRCAGRKLAWCCAATPAYPFRCRNWKRGVMRVYAGGMQKECSRRGAPAAGVFARGHTRTHPIATCMYVYLHVLLFVWPRGHAAVWCHCHAAVWSYRLHYKQQ